MSYKTTVNKNLDFEIHQKSMDNFDVIRISDSKYHVLDKNESFNAEIIESNFNSKTYTVSVNNNIYQVDILSDLDVLIKEMGFEIGATKRVNDVKAPMPGLILEISVKEGQEVKEDDPIIILEAMKMENVIKSPGEGKVSKIHVSEKENVEKNQVLISFE